MLGATDTTSPGSFLPTMNEAVAGRSAMRVLITAKTALAVETIGRRIHAASAGAESNFVRFRAGRFPIEPARLRATCTRLLELAAGGTLLLSDIETMPGVVQHSVIELFDELARTRAVKVRLVSGTTVLLFNHVVAGTFSERLFYRLNVVHVDDAWTVEAAAGPSHLDAVRSIAAQPSI